MKQYISRSPISAKAPRSANHGYVNTKVYRAWRGAKTRAFNVNGQDYRHYGGRGITMCDRWAKSFLNFLEDMGEPPTKHHTLERINNNAGYEPSNCRWATRKEQAQNTRRNHLITFNGETKTLGSWSKELELSDVTLLRRIARGWSMKDVLTRRNAYELTDEQRANIRKLRKQGWSINDLAGHFHKHKITIRKIIGWD